VKCLVDEGVDFPVVRHLRDRGYDVASVLEDDPGGTDKDVLARAVAEARLLVTNDKDFGEMVYRQQYEVTA
jgi:predicted nuclease of predicted toxin-antitoxin system